MKKSHKLQIKPLETPKIWYSCGQTTPDKSNLSLGRRRSEDDGGNSSLGAISEEIDPAEEIGIRAAAIVASSTIGCAVRNTLTSSPSLELSNGEHEDGADDDESSSWKCLRPETHQPATASLQLNLDDLKQGALIGHGSFGFVCQAVHVPTGVVYALKCVDLAAAASAYSRMKQSVLARLSTITHPNIVTYYAAFVRDHHLKLVMEFMDLGPVSATLPNLGPISMDILAEIMKQALFGLTHLHQHGILHRDLKPSNLLLSSHGFVKISDFGVAALLSDCDKPLSERVDGSTAYMSPERVRGEPHGYECDIWSLGVTCAECALGIYPFRPTDTTFPLSPLLLRNSSSSSSSVSDECRDLCAGLLEEPINLFDLQLLISENAAVVDWNKLMALISFAHENDQNHRHPPSISVKPLPSVSEECKEFVSQCLQQDPKARPHVHDLQKHPFVCSHQRDGPFQVWLKRVADHKISY